MTDIEVLAGFSGFEWDDGNTGKIGRKHRVTAKECEEVFENVPFVVAEDAKHSDRERRYFAVGMADSGRVLFLAFTLRENRIRVISARTANRRERKVYGVP